MLKRKAVLLARNGKNLIHFSKIYSFSRHNHHQGSSKLGQKGYSRVVYCNDPGKVKYRGNYVSTTKYTAINFIPKSLFEQFRRVANIYFLVVALVSFSPLAPFTAPSILFPLVIVIGATMVKEAIEDCRRRKQDIEANNRKAKAYAGDTFHETRWKTLRVGDLVKVEKDDFFPADMLLLSSSYEDGICYVETMNLDGETNLKVKQAKEVTSGLQDEDGFGKFKAVIKCEDPNENLYSFIGSLDYDGSQYPLSPQNILLRDSKLRNTDYVYGIVIFTGHDTKVMKNTTDPPSKRSKIEMRMDKIIYVLFGVLILLSFVGSIFFGIRTKEDLNGGVYKRWYLRPDVATVYFDPRRASLAAFFHFVTDLMLYGYLIPISLYVSIEIVKVLQIIFVNQDPNMYDEETDRPAEARTSNLNEELGQVNTILSDKTGTLTCNSMEFIKCSIGGTAYGRGVTEVEKAIERKKKDRTKEPSEESSDSEEHGDDIQSPRAPIKGFNFTDERIMDGHWVEEPQSDIIQKFFRALAICHTAIPDEDTESGEITYEAESPDEAAFVIAARELGFEFCERTQSHILIHEVDPVTGKRVDRSYELLDVLEFSSSRKRMSVIVRNEEGQLLLICKGADSIMFGRLSEEGRTFKVKTKEHIKNYGEAGLRTLVVAYRDLNEEDYRVWKEEFLEARNSVSEDRDALVDAVADKIERDLILLGATAVEDKLQKGVPDCISKLAKAGIKIWVLTGDKLETAVNIGYACSLLRQGMRQVVITLDTDNHNDLQKKEDKEAIKKARESIRKQIEEGIQQIGSAKQSSVESALIIDGNSLTHALTGNLENLFLDLAIDCASVICCRSSPKQKALVTKLVKKRTGKTTLAIGDGANDVSMLHEADIGVGISGVEGRQAVMSSDFAIGQFRFLERLLLVHGHWCYRRISKMICYFFYKNVTFGFTLFWFEAYASFSGQPAYNDWYLSFYNVFFTSLPVIALGVFEQDVPAQLCLKYPILYQEGVKNILFSWLRILGWMFNGICSSVVIFFFTTSSIFHQAFRTDGRVAGVNVIGVSLYSCVVWTVNCQIVVATSYFAWIQHLFIWGSIVLWYIFLVVFGSLSPTVSTTAYKVLVEACAPSILYWETILLVVISSLLPYFTFKACQVNLYPTYHHVVQKREFSKTDHSSSFNSQSDERMSSTV
ncbi:P-type phospholipid transporter [Ranunculus cassubicifolius]